MANSANRNYPKVTPGKFLSEDVGNVNDAIDAIDADVQSLVAATAEIVPSESPAFSGTPTAPTAPPGTNNQQLANTQFVALALANLIGAAPSQLDAINELAAAIDNDPNFAATMIAALADKASLAQLAGKLDNSGGTLTGNLNIDPVAAVDFGDSMVIGRDVGNGNRGFQISSNIVADIEGTNLRFYNNGNHALNIDSDGIIAKPSQPGFAARGYTSRDVNGNHIYSVTDFNEGNHYNPATGIFTAPETGVYAVHAFVGYKETTNYLGLSLLVNGSNYQQAWTDNTIHSNNAALGGPIKLIEGDTLNVGSHPNYTFPNSIIHYSGFSAYLMG